MADELPLVAIIILNWNRREDTVACLTSLQNSSYPNCLIILVDNGSSDGTANHIRNCFPTVHVLENGQNLGFAEGNNVGIRYAMARGARYLYLLNNDTIVDAQCIQHLADAGQAYPAAGALCPTVISMSQPERLEFAGATWSPQEAVFKFHRPSQTDNLHQDRQVIETDTLLGCALFCTAAAISAIGMLDPRFYLLWEESDWCARARSRGFSLLYVPAAKIWHKGSVSFSEGRWSVQYRYYFIRNRLLWFEKNLHGAERRRAMMQVIKELYWYTVTAKQAKRRFQGDDKWRATFFGLRDYFLRRFGPRVVK